MGKDIAVNIKSLIDIKSAGNADRQNQRVKVLENTAKNREPSETWLSVFLLCKSKINYLSLTV